MHHVDETAPAVAPLSSYMKRRLWLIAEGILPDRKRGRCQEYQNPRNSTQHCSLLFDHGTDSNPCDC